MTFPRPAAIAIAALAVAVGGVADAQEPASPPGQASAPTPPPPAPPATSAGSAAATTPAPPSSNAPPLPIGPVGPVAPAEGEGDEPEHPPAPPPTKPVPGFARQPTVVKDGMVRIPGGRFTMGTSDRTAPSNERPARGVVTPTFWIDRTEVTVGAYRACVERGACQRPPRSSTVCTFDFGDPQLPVSCVPWALAQAYCVAAGKRLPHEVEWEHAARGPSNARYPWGGAGAGCGAAITLAADGSQRSCGGKRPARVGARPGGASIYGVLDLSGNVEEWVADWYGESVSDASPRAGASHVLRGGGWLSTPSASKTTSRNWGSVREAGPNVGFRCARDDA